MFLARVFITLKPTVNDPEGRTIMSGLHEMGFNAVSNVRSGTYMEVSLNVDSEVGAEREIRSMCDKLLANPVIEEYRYELQPAG